MRWRRGDAATAWDTLAGDTSPLWILVVDNHVPFTASALRSARRLGSRRAPRCASQVVSTLDYGTAPACEAVWRVRVIQDYQGMGNYEIVVRCMYIVWSNNSVGTGGTLSAPILGGSSSSGTFTSQTLRLQICPKPASRRNRLDPSRSHFPLCPACIFNRVLLQGRSSTTRNRAATLFPILFPDRTGASDFS
ncbi:uncharacterized protein EI97DRAFT_249093 [Westerdykella ornata]|uniref:Uncharacterized protein n=1 Tax=Westerdykella ornata TaxID=318751 RepID=A0A6A6JP12_WESOR|nr:uncharacterized protein EI97DRAFT_249093 [Westerdykella ornata]KAF2278262.1 hypothetical protein EI97DRAFT_249093 [Westerdykella ornata]